MLSTHFAKEYFWCNPQGIRKDVLLSSAAGAQLMIMGNRYSWVNYFPFWKISEDVQEDMQKWTAFFPDFFSTYWKKGPIIRREGSSFLQ